MKKPFQGINIQWPISELILKGDKTIETRTYPIPSKLLNQDLVMVETPGKLGKFKARNVAIIRFTECFPYTSKEEFYMDYDRHKVLPESIWAWREEAPKWGWKVEVLKLISPPQECQSRGIVYRSNIRLQ